MSTVVLINPFEVPEGKEQSLLDVYSHTILSLKQEMVIQLDDFFERH